MAWASPEYNRGRVDAAGNELVTASPQFDVALDIEDWQEEWETTLQVINNWRSSHSYPLQAIKMTLLGRAKNIESTAIVAQRLKRLSSIKAKLTRNPHMKLSQMQDIGGCRAIVRTAHAVRRLVVAYDASTARNPMRGPECSKRYDYIANPKPDGYRSYHLVYKYRTDSKHRIYNGLRIEIQLRSRLQHAWATAVETVDTFTRQALKSGLGDPAWKRFFALMGTALALRERTPPVPDTPAEEVSLQAELREITHRLHALTVLQGLGSALTLEEEVLDPKAAAYLLELNSNERSVAVSGFRQENLREASEQYLATERRISNTPHIQAVLVSVSSLAALRSAYPNYYLDTTAFLTAVRRAIGEPS